MEKNLDLGLELLHHVENQLARADAKAQYTLIVDALLLVGVAFTTAPASGVAHRVAMLLAAAALFISILFCLAVVMPKLNPPKEVNLFYFSSILTLSEADFMARFRALQAPEVETMLLSELYVLSAITQGKFLKIRRSHLALYVGLGLWALAYLLR